MPKYGADGDVIDISLHTVSVQNWDNTITTIPTYSLVSHGFKNWRGMSESGGRRIKRAINIIMLHYSCKEWHFDEAILTRVKIWKIEIDEISGKMSGY